MHEWTVRRSPFQNEWSSDPNGTQSIQNFMSATEFCIRGCKDGPDAAALCMHIYDTMGSLFIYLKSLFPHHGIVVYNLINETIVFDRRLLVEYAR